MIRLFVQSPLSFGNSVSLGDKQVHYLFHVMRQNKGDEVALFNGSDGQWSARIIDISKSKATLECFEQTRSQTEEKLSSVWLCFSPVKKENIDFIVQKATELGVEALCPVITHRTVGKANISRMKLQVIEASEQCERLSVPKVAETRLLNSFLSSFPKDRTLYFLNERNEGLCQLHVEKKVAFLVGPEGGFDQDELRLIDKQGFSESIHFGRRILRAETACVVALACYNQTLLWKV